MHLCARARTWQHVTNEGRPAPAATRAAAAAAQHSACRWLQVAAMVCGVWHAAPIGSSADQRCGTCSVGALGMHAWELVRPASVHGGDGSEAPPGIVHCSCVRPSACDAVTARGWHVHRMWAAACITAAHSMWDRSTPMRDAASGACMHRCCSCMLLVNASTHLHAALSALHPRRPTPSRAGWCLGRRAWSLSLPAAVRALRWAAWAG